MRNNIEHNIYKITVLICVCLCGYTSFAQKSDIKVVADPRIDSLVRVQSGKDTDLVKGFRIQITTEKKKSDIENLRRKLIADFPGLATYIEYNAPNYILKVGDFRFKEDAHVVKAQLTEYPYAFIKEELVYNKRN